MSKRRWTDLAVLFIWLGLSTVRANGAKITITQTGSTNTRGLEISLDEAGNASVHSEAEPTRQVVLEKAISSDFVRAVESAGRLHALSVGHCMKSASFGTSLFITRGDDRSPDLSCPVPSNRVSTDLKKRAEEILQLAQKAAGVQTFRGVAKND